jgi:hypothetical protein
VDNSIKLKELQVVSGALRKGDKGLVILFCFFKRFFLGEDGRWGNSSPFQRRFFSRNWNR